MRRNSLDLQQMQCKKLKAIIGHAYDHVAFYRRKFDSCGMRPEDIHDLADIAKLPFTTKAEIQSQRFEDVVANSTIVHRCVKRETSGSTGIPLTIVLDDKAVDSETATWTRTYLENGLKARDTMAIVAHPEDFPTKGSFFHGVGVMRKKYISVFENIERQVKILEQYHPDAIKGYASALSLLAEKKTESLRPRLLFSGAELLDFETRKRINASFENQLLDNYGCAEFSLMSWECKEHSGYHINVDSVLMEIIRNDEPVGPEERGEIVCTGLSNYAMPLIRFRLEDVGMMNPEACTCDVKLPLMKIIEGRTEDFLITPDGKRIPPSLFFPYPFERNDEIKQFRVVQETRNRLVFQVVPKRDLSRETIERANSRIKKIFGEDVQVEFRVMEKIERSEGGKMRKVISRVPQQRDW